MSSKYGISGDQMNKIHEILENPPMAPDFARSGEANPHLKVYVVNFDGTRNQKDVVDHRVENMTLVAENHERMIVETYNDPNLKTKYYRGVGTGLGTGFLIDGIMDAIVGYNCAPNAANAHKDFVEQAKAWAKEDPNVEVHVHVVGFSRGSATALEFLNLVEERGAGTSREKGRHLPLALQPGNVKSSAVLYDTVSTGQSAKLNLTVPQSTVALLHLTAGGEERALFPLRNISQDPEKERSYVMSAQMDGGQVTPDGLLRYNRIQEISLPAARHSDVGGSYKDGNFREVSDYLSSCFQASLGLPVTPVKPTFEQVQKLEFHDSRYYKSFVINSDYDSRVNAKRRETGVQKDIWDGEVTMETQITGFSKIDMFSCTDMNMSYHVDPDSREWVSNALGKKVEIQLQRTNDPLNSPDLMRDFDLGDIRELRGFKIRSSNLDDLSVKNGMLTHLGWPVDGLPMLDQLAEQMDEAKKEGNFNGTIKIEIDKNRLGVIVSADQKPHRLPAIKIEESLDPWPESARDLLVDLNGSKTKFHKEFLNETMNVIYRSCAKQIMENFPEFDKVRIVPENANHYAKDNIPFTTFRIFCESKGKVAFSTESYTGRASEREYDNEMRGIRRCLIQIDERLQSRGLLCSVNNEFSMTKDGKSELKDSNIISEKMDLKTRQTQDVVPTGLFQAMGVGQWQPPSKNGNTRTRKFNS